MLHDEKKEHAIKRLHDIVSEFNETFQSWMEETGCRAAFGWTYNPGGNRDQIKGLEIQGIDLIVFRKPPPAYLGGGTPMDRSQPSEPSADKAVSP